MTFSVVARDDDAGLLGVAVASCVLAVGTRVPMARAGVGVVAVQAGGWLHWRQALLDLLDRGLSAQEALAVIRTREDADAAQVAVVGSAGPAAVHTGPDCDQPAGHVTFGAASVQANTMADDRTWPVMREAFAATDGLANALVAALAAADRHGGDLRGRQSAALLIVPMERGHLPTGDGDDPTVDLRVDDSPDPVGALMRLLRIHRAHRLLIRSGEQDTPEAAHALLHEAAALTPGDPLTGPAAGISLALAGHLDDGLALLRQGLTINPDALRWARWCAERNAGVNPDAQALLDALDAE